MRYLKSFYESMKSSIPFDFIRSEGCQVFLHTTSISNAEEILKDGFIFSNCDIFKTVDPIYGDPKDFNFMVEYLLSGRKAYGDAVVVIHIGFNLLKKYGGYWEDHLSERIDDFDEDKFGEVEFITKLHKQFIRGYFIRRTGDFFENPEYNPTLDKPEFGNK